MSPSLRACLRRMLTTDVYAECHLPWEGREARAGRVNGLLNLQTTSNLNIPPRSGAPTLPREVTFGVNIRRKHPA